MGRRARLSALTASPSATSRLADEVSSSISTVATRPSLVEATDLAEYRQLFNMFDTDGSGAIGNAELKEALLNFGQDMTDAEIDDLIREVDDDGNGEIDFTEFCQCMRRSQRVKCSNEEFVRQCFNVFDQDGNGVITKNEFKYIAKEVGGFSDELAETIFHELDVSSNGYFSADQFAAIVDDYMLNDQSRLYDDRVAGPQFV